MLPGLEGQAALVESLKPVAQGSPWNLKYICNHPLGAALNMAQ